MKKINQSGFSPIVILLVLILVVLVGFTGYYVYNTQKKDESKAAAVPAPANVAATPAQPSTQDTQKFLVIKEWGVKIPLTDANADAYYVYKKFEGGDAVYVSTKSIAAKYPECGADKTTLFAYGRFDDLNKFDDLYGKKFSELYPNAPKVGDYYYTATPPQAGCAYTANGEIDMEYQDSTILPARKAFSDAAQKIQAQ